MIRVVLADDHAVVTRGLRALLRRKFTLLTTVQNGRGLVAEVL
jgi:DNA-binding NarL/FixJ family response regulator